jgi:2TM domain
MTINQAAPDSTLRERAVKRLKKRRDFQGHLIAYALVNAFVVLIWAITDPHGFFWPIFPMAGWGIGVVLNAWDVYRNDELDEQRIQHEMERIQRER